MLHICMHACVIITMLQLREVNLFICSLDLDYSCKLLPLLPYRAL